MSIHKISYYIANCVMIDTPFFTIYYIALNYKIYNLYETCGFFSNDEKKSKSGRLKHI